MDASSIPPEWHQWLHHVVDEIPSKTNLAAFKPHYLRGRTPTKTGTPDAYSSPHYVGSKDFKPYKKKGDSWDPNNKPSSSSQSL